MTLKLPIDAYLLSFPKVGRTWLRYLIGSYLNRHFILNLSEEEQLNLQRFCNLIVVHDDNVDKLPFTAFKTDKSRFFDRSIILMVREPKDVVVSWYFEKSKRHARLWNLDGYNGSLSDFIRSEYGIRAVCRYYQIWAEYINKIPHLYIVRYEDLKKHPERELKNLLFFLGLEVDDKSLNRSIQQCSFDAMKNLERSHKIQARCLRPSDEFDPESYKVRRGIIGGYKSYFSSEDLQYSNQIIDFMFPNAYDYNI